jgi:hypothetical protein
MVRVPDLREIVGEKLEKIRRLGGRMTTTVLVRSYSDTRLSSSTTISDIDRVVEATDRKCRDNFARLTIAAVMVDIFWLCVGLPGCPGARMGYYAKDSNWSAINTNTCSRLARTVSRWAVELLAVESLIFQFEPWFRSIQSWFRACEPAIGRLWLRPTVLLRPLTG